MLKCNPDTDHRVQHGLRYKPAGRQQQTCCCTKFCLPTRMTTRRGLTSSWRGRPRSTCRHPGPGSARTRLLCGRSLTPTHSAAHWRGEKHLEAEATGRNQPRLMTQQQRGKDGVQHHGGVSRINFFLCSGSTTKNNY